MNAEEKRAERRIALCGTETYWPKPEVKPYLVDYSGNPIPQDVIRELWPELETTK